MNRLYLAGILLALGTAGACTKAPVQEVATRGEIVRLSSVSAPAANASAYGSAFNAFRAQKGLPQLRRSPRLEAAARKHARDIANMGKLTHRGSDGSQISGRVKATGYPMRRVAENAAWTAQGFDRVLKIWEGSPPHRKNMLRRDVEEYGLAKSGPYWVLVVGQKR
ncbi:CAP domain-containing protein [Salipiger sp.]|uniref:CAP domain-containing protein n=1 Tax=Salipiger sp. TaxID=2078585 RepID=UPI003A980901